jgi:multiple sugar transport system substrate-binding protein
MRKIKRAIPFFILAIFLLTSGFGCKVLDQKTQEAMKPITLNYWRVWDGPDAFEEIIAAYKALHPFVNINYRKLRYGEFEDELIDALAEDRGPDIFSIHNTWIKKYESKIAPMPATVTMAYPVVRGTLKKETIPELRSVRSLTLKEIENNFVDTVSQDIFVRVKNEKSGQMEDKVMGLPLSVDTLAMFYNKDLLNNAGIPEPPSHWNKNFQQYVKKLTKQDIEGDFQQYGVALGSSANIERSSDILSLLIMQNGAEMQNESGQIMFGQVPAAFSSHNYNPGLEALRFYTDFANPAKEVYSWNKAASNSIKAFAEGKLAFAFGYSYHLPTIRAEASKLNFGVAKMPQIEGNPSLNFANYWVETVSKKSKLQNEAWDFIQFAAKAENVKSYLDKTKKPTALRALVAAQLDDKDVGVFADQVLTAKSWYHGADAEAMEAIFGDMIDNVASGQMTVEQALGLAVSKTQQTVEAKEKD